MTHFSKLKQQLENQNDREGRKLNKENIGLNKFIKDFKNILESKIIPAFTEINELINKSGYHSTFTQNKSKKTSDLGEILILAKEWRKEKIEISAITNKQKVCVSLFRIPNSKKNAFVKYNEKILNIEDITYEFLETRIQQMIKKL